MASPGRALRIPGPATRKPEHTPGPWPFRGTRIRRSLRTAAILLILVGAASRAEANLFQQGSKLVGTGASGNPQLGTSVAVSADGNTAVVGGPFDTLPVGAVWVFVRSGQAWSQQGAKLVGTGGLNARQGAAVAVSADGNTALVGGPADNTNTGAVWVWTRSGSVWSQQGTKLVGSGAVGGAQQGYAVALSADGNTAVVGGYSDNSNTGAAWVWTRSGGVWSQQGAKLVGTGAVGSARQGWAVAVSADGNTAVVGGYSDNGNAGAVWVWTRSGGVWSQQGAKLVGIGAAGSAQQGTSVALSADGNMVMFGGNTDNANAGAVWVWTRSGGVWSQSGAKLVGTGATSGAVHQGTSVSVSADGSAAVIGGHGDNFNVGAVWMWTRSGGVWSQSGAKRVATDGVGAAQHGFSVALSADGATALVGGYNDNSGAGAAWAYAYPAPRIASIVDVANDQGGKVHVLWDASLLDVAPSYAIRSYNLWRRIATTAAAQAAERGATFVRSGEGIRAGAATVAGRRPIRMTTVGTQAVYWEFVESIPARGVSGYGYMAPTTSNVLPGPISTQQGGKLVGTGAVGVSQQGNSVAVSADGSTAIVGGYGDNSYAGAAWVWTRDGGTWTQQGAKLVGAGAVGNGQQGTSVAVSADGNTAVVGGPYDNGQAGAAWVFVRSGGVWSQQGPKLVGAGAAGTARQGTSVAISADGNTVVVGGRVDNFGAGAAWVFVRSGGVWSQQGGKLVGTGAVGSAEQGSAVAVSADGNTAVVGGYYDSVEAGAAWVWTRSGGVWSQQGAKLVGTGAVGAARQGWSVAVSGDGNTAVVGGHYDNNTAGAAWVFTRSGGVWSQQGAKLVGTGAVGDAQQGISVSSSSDGNTIVVGGIGDDLFTGAMWIWGRSGGVWSQQGGKLVGANGGQANQGIAVAVSADGNTALVGGLGADGSTGAAWVFTPVLPWNVFFVDAEERATTAFYVSAPDSGYSVDDLSPAPPAGVTAVVVAGSTHLHWGVSPEADFGTYRIYRGTSSSFVPGSDNLVATQADTGYVDVGQAGSHYKISAMDVHGNESGFTAAYAPQSAGVDGPPPLAFALEGVRPNPARGRDLTVRFVLPTRAPARLELIDVAGRRVVTREVGPLGPGAQSVNLADRARVRPGLYFITLRQGANEQRTRVVVLD